jgi:colanic acid/amylovoran biosynthesis glycosyltransferase
MNVLIVVDKFPTVSETFIRNHITGLIDNGFEVYIYPKNGRSHTKELDALIGFENYALDQRIIDLDSDYVHFKPLRLLKAFFLLFAQLFRTDFRYYRASLDVNRFGAIAKSLRLLFRVHNLLKYDIDIIHAHFGPNGERMAFVKKMGLPIKLFTTFHGYDIRLGLQKGGGIYKDLFYYADGVIAITEYNKQKLLSFGLNYDKLIVLPNGIDVSYFKCNNIRTEGSTIRLLTVARLVEEKALDIAIHAVSEVLRLQPDLNISYTIVGDGELSVDLQVLIDQLQLQHVIKLVGSKTTKEVKDLMHTHHLFLLPSKEEVLPTVLLEAQASGMMVLATDVGSVKAIVKSGMVVPANDVDGFRDALLALLNETVTWEDEGKIGQDYIETHYNVAKQIEELVALYCTD